jgi:alkylation response protein AidB-like acyl-CoA dehydrogenase
LLAEHAAESERLRKPVDAVIEALCDAEIFKIMVPPEYGGFGLDLDTLFDVALELSQGDASAGWVTAFYIEHNWMLCSFPEPFQRELFADRNFVLAPGMISPAGKARRDAGGKGVRLEGRWPWATGVMHSDWIIAGGIVKNPDADGGIDPRFFALPQEHASVEDTWYMDGMEGTGSNDVVVDDVFVPDDASVSLVEMCNGNAPGSRIHEAPLYRTPMVPLLAITAAVPILGQAKFVVRTFRERMHERMIMMLGARQSDTPAAQSRLARVEVEVHSAELMLRDAMQQLFHLRNRATVEDRARLRAQIALAVERCYEVVETVCNASGASAHQRSNPLQRARRDVNVMRAHTVFDADSILQIFGALRVGQKPATPMI